MRPVCVKNTGCASPAFHFCRAAAWIFARIFISRTGEVRYVHSGQYVSEGTLAQDIEAYALGG